eukprot:355645-Chlamydomonas_euryale.AAC.45
MVDENIEERRCDYAPLSHSCLDIESDAHAHIHPHSMPCWFEMVTAAAGTAARAAHQAAPRRQRPAAPAAPRAPPAPGSARGLAAAAAARLLHAAVPAHNQAWWKACRRRWARGFRPGCERQARGTRSAAASAACMQLGTYRS